MGSTGSARAEAERLIATVLAMAANSPSGSAAGGFLGGGLGDLVMGALGQAGSGATRSSGWATGSAECCVCPVCRIIAGLRDPSPQMAERLATGAGDFAAGLASLLRNLSAATAAPEGAGSGAAAEDSGSGSTPDAPAQRASHWSAATAADRTPAQAAPSVWSDAAAAVDETRPEPSRPQDLNGAGGRADGRRAGLPPADAEIEGDGSGADGGRGREDGRAPGVAHAASVSRDADPWGAATRASAVTDDQASSDDLAGDIRPVRGAGEDERG